MIDRRMMLECDLMLPFVSGTSISLMPQTTEELEDDGSKNMVSNLPLLFADGYPTSLDKITETQLERFIPFMVQCSLGNVTIHTMTEFNKPLWWPKDLEFTKPFKRPKSFTGDWLLKMRELVVACYDSHDNIYLLRYCADLAKFQPTALRFINNYNSTTSLFERSTNKLLVTFRNENMLYDQEQKINSRKCLLPKQSNSQSCLAAQEEMVISAGFDIYLCDYCDAELYSYGAMVLISAHY
uniref:Nuclear respiratory factor 1 NLS/DNA-binding dimerisation domain-containing protein n=1 Tax=Anopheles maculatus TaxID=74869 RepID=A0A182SDI6_9DIPT